MKKMFLAASDENEKLYFVIGGELERDGVLLAYDQVRYVPFWSYINRMPMSRVKENEIQKNLWDGDTASQGWTDHFYYNKRTDLFEAHNDQSIFIDVPEETN